MRIPKIIYSTWISHAPLPERFNKYIESWKKFLPDYEIRMITLENTPRNSFIDTFIENQKYAVAAQYARCQRIFETGGIYFDIDIEVIKSFDDLRGYGMFAGIESDEVDHYVNNALFGAAKGHPFMLECMSYMDNIDVNRNNIEVGTGPLMFTELLKRKGWVPSNKTAYYSGNIWNDGKDKNSSFDNIQLFNSKHFYPYFYTEQFKPGCITKDTYSIHHWAATWKNSVSVIILCNEKTEYLEESIESAIEQTVDPIEIVVVNKSDHANADGIRNIVENYKVKLIETPDGNLSSAKNAGIDFAKGRWMFVINAGDKLHSDLVEKIIDKADIVGTGTGEINSYPFFKIEVWEKIKGYDETMEGDDSDGDFLKRAGEEGLGLKFYIVGCLNSKIKAFSNFNKFTVLILP